MLIRQLFDRETWTYTYLLGDLEASKAVVIDPVAGQVERDLRLLDELGLELRFTLDTHVHADHVTGSGLLRERVGAKSVVAQSEGVACADVGVVDGDKVSFGRYEIEARATPGHTGGCISYVVRDEAKTYAFTGDTLLIRGCGRTDFQAGDAKTLYRSVHTKLFSLPDDTVVFPGHDYKGHTSSTIGEEKAHNPRLKLGTSEAQFVQIMSELKLANPKYIDVAVPANLSCGRVAEGTAS